MTAAQRISRSRLMARIGREETVLVDAHQEGVALARSRGDAPEIDGLVRITGKTLPPVGEFARVRVTAADDYDVEATPLS